MNRTLTHPTTTRFAAIGKTPLPRTCNPQSAQPGWPVAVRVARYGFGLLLLLGVQLQADSIIQFSVSTYSVTEGTDQVEIAVQRTNDLDTAVSVDFATASLSATAGADYVDVATNLTFLAGQTNKIVGVPLFNDGLVEGIEIFQILLSNPTGGAVLGSRANATVRITSNDTGLQVEFAKYQALEDEGTVLIGVVRGDDGNFPVTVEYVTADITATAGQDYTATAGRLEFAPGEKLRLLTVSILNDGLKEPNRSFRLSLTNATGTVVASPSSATITLVDNDPGVQFEFDSYWVLESEGALTVRVLRGSDAELGEFTVDYATTNVTATAGEDYPEIRGTLEFTGGETVKLLTVPIAADQVVEPDEKFTITLANPTGSAWLGKRSVATVTILDATGMAGHGFDDLSVLSSQGAQLVLGGGVHPRFKDYFDLYPIDVSSNLMDWTPLVTLQRANGSTNTLTFPDPEAAKFDKRFYRTVTNHLITALSQPTGPFPVGVVSRMVNDSSRRNRYSVSTNGSFMASIWYPSLAETGRLPVPYEDEMLMRDARFPTSLLQRCLCTFAHAQQDAHCATQAAPCPVVVYSHGWTAGRTCQVVGQAENLASHGYVVVSMDHFDARFSRFPDGACRFGDVSGTGLSEAGFRDRVRDIQVLMDHLVRWNDGDPVLAGCLDMTKVAAMGLSWGGGTAAEACRIDSRIQAAVQLDPALGEYSSHAPDLVQQGLQKPLITMHSTELGTGGNLYDRATRDATLLLIGPSQHLNYGDSWWWELPTPDFVQGREIARTIRAYTLAFLNRHLKGLDEPMPTKADYPRVINLKQK